MIVTFGEVLLRLSPPNHRRFSQADTFEAYYGGAEANTAVSLCCLGEPARHVTRLPANDLGRACRGELARWGVDTSGISFETAPDARLGLYFCESGVSQRPSRVIYDRKNSSFARWDHRELDWDALLEDADWFHFTGITPALGEELAAAALEGCAAAKKRGIPVSMDLNYRANLWSKTQAGEVLSRYLEFVDVLFANNGSLADVFGIDEENSAVDNDPSATLAAAREASRRFGIGEVALTMRQSISASCNQWSALVYHGETGQHFLSQGYRMEIVDRIGGGDSFAAGLIYAKRRKFDHQHAVEFAAAASCLKHTIHGDVNPVTEQEVENLLACGGAGLIQR